MPMTTAEARALGSPARQAIVAFLGAESPATVAALADHIGLTANAVRKHLASLVGAGLVVEDREVRTVPGRPRLLYRLRPGLDAPPGEAYERLSALLARAVGSDEDIAEIGRRQGRTVSHTAGTAPVDALVARFAADGFAPSVERRGGRVEIVLGACPFASAAEANPAAVCRLHLGLAEGAAEAIGGLTVDGLAARDPRRAGCRVAVTETGG